MFVEMCSSASFKAPIGVKEALDLRWREKSSGDGKVQKSIDTGGGDGGGGGNSFSHPATPPIPYSSPTTSSSPLYLPAFDGLVVLGIQGPSGVVGSDNCAWEDADLQKLFSSFFSGGQPVALFSTAVCLGALSTIGGSTGEGGAEKNTHHYRPSVLRGRVTTAPTLAQELGLAWLEGLTGCRWRYLREVLRAQREKLNALDVIGGACYSGGLGGLHGAREEKKQLLLLSPKGKSPPSATLFTHLLRKLDGGGDFHANSLAGLIPPRPTPSINAIVSQDGQYLSSQSAAGAFALARLLIEKIEQSGRTF